MKTCRVCNEAHYGLGYCRKHYRQITRHGVIRERLTTDPNEFIICGHCLHIHMYDRNALPTHIAIVDIEDLDKVVQYKWSASITKRVIYAQAYIDGKMTLLHRHILNVQDRSCLVDHIDHNGLNCKRENMRLASYQQNSYNRRRNTGKGYTKYKGVYWHNRDKIWWSYITSNGRRIHLGVFATDHEAALAYDKKTIELHGDYANLNFPK